MVAAGDYAGMVSRALRTPESASRHLYVFGPKPLTIAEALRLYSAVVEGAKRVVTVPLPVMKGINRFFMGGAMRRELGLMDLMQRLGEPSDVPDAAQVLGPATTTLRQWGERRAAGAP